MHPSATRTITVKELRKYFTIGPPLPKVTDWPNPDLDVDRPLVHLLRISPLIYYTCPPLNYLLHILPPPSSVYYIPSALIFLLIHPFIRLMDKPLTTCPATLLSPPRRRWFLTLATAPRTPRSPLKRHSHPGPPTYASKVNNCLPNNPLYYPD